MTSSAPQTHMTFSEALRRERSKGGRSLHELSCGVSVSESVIRAWEGGESTPTRGEFKLLCLQLRRMRFYPPPEYADKGMSKQRLCTDCRRAQTSTGICANCAQEREERGDELPPPAADVPVIEPLPVANDFAPRSFGEALRRERELEGADQEEVAYVIGVTGQAVSHWEVERNAPVEEHYERLCELFPRLRSAPKPPTQDIPKPDGGRGVERVYGTGTDLPSMRQDAHAFLADATDSRDRQERLRTLHEELPRDCRRALRIPKIHEQPPPIAAAVIVVEPSKPTTDIGTETLAERIINAYERFLGGAWALTYSRAGSTWSAVVTQENRCFKEDGDDPRAAGKALLRKLGDQIQEQAESLRRRADELEKLRKTMGGG